MRSSKVNLKKLFKKREQHYLATTQEILEVFLPPLSDAIKDVIYDGKPINILVKGVYPVIDNLNYISIIAKVSDFSIGDIISVIDDSNTENVAENVAEDVTEDIEITKNNYWKWASTITLNMPISVLETQDENAMMEFLNEVYDEDSIETTFINEDGKILDDETFDESKLDKTQQELLGLQVYGKNNGIKH